MDIKIAEEKNLKDCYKVIVASFKYESNIDIYIKYDKFLKAYEKGVEVYFISEDNNIIGCIGIEKKSDIKYKIRFLSVLPEYRHLGYGKKLIYNAEQIVSLKSGNKISLGMNYSNKVLLNWYESLGYKVDKIKEYKKGSIEIAFMNKDILKLESRVTYVMRNFNKISKVKKQCLKCGLEYNNCICDYKIIINSGAEIWLLTHMNELERTNNTGRLIENAINTTKVFKWERTVQNKELKKLIESNKYNIYIIMAADREEEIKRKVNYKKNSKQTVFLILDGTWKEVRKILRKTECLNDLPILSLDVDKKTEYELRRNSDDNHICTVEVGIELLNIIGEDENSQELYNYYKIFLEKYDDIRYNH